MQDASEITVIALERHGDAVLVLVGDPADALGVDRQRHHVRLAEFAVRGVDDHLDAVGDLMVEIRFQLLVGGFQTERAEFSQVIVLRVVVIDVEMVGLDVPPFEAIVLNTVLPEGKELRIGPGKHTRDDEQRQKDDETFVHGVEITF